MLKKLFSCIVVILCVACVTNGQNAKLYNVNIVDVENGKVIPGMTVSLKNGKIDKIKKAKKKIKEGQTDYTGLFLMPGLIDSHTHWGSFSVTPQYMQSMADSYIADGVTTVRDAGGDARIVRRYEAKQDSGKIIGPKVYISSFWAGPKYYGKGVRQDTRGYGCTGLKLYNDISYEMLKKIVPLCHKHGVKPWGHFATFPATAMDVIKAGVETVSHTYLIDGMEGFTPEFKAKRFTPEEIERRDSIFREMARRGTILDATVKICMEGNMEFAARYTNEAYRAGVKIAAGTDWVHMEWESMRSAFLDELDLLADSCGMSIPDVLRAATTVGAEVIGQVGSVGVIREGADADLLVLKTNPLESLKALRQRVALYLNGKEIK